jgi:hypothetical protein
MCGVNFLTELNNLSVNPLSQMGGQLLSEDKINTQIELSQFGGNIESDSVATVQNNEDLKNGPNGGCMPIYECKESVEEQMTEHKKSVNDEKRKQEYAKSLDNSISIHKILEERKTKPFINF